MNESPFYFIDFLIPILARTAVSSYSQLLKTYIIGKLIFPFFPLTNLKLSFSLFLSPPFCFCSHLPLFCLCSTLPARTWADRSPRRRASRGLRNWMSCSLKPVQKLATMSNRYRLNEMRAAPPINQLFLLLPLTGFCLAVPFSFTQCF